jgi:two-component system phosphate regulon sensor histidine kinase PhoR
MLLLVVGGGAFFTRTTLQNALLQHGSLGSAEGLSQALRSFDHAVVLVFLTILATMLLFVAWTYRSFLLPVADLFARTRLPNSPREMTDLEGSLDVIRKDLESKTESLAREREELTTLMSAISDGILAIDSDGIPLFYNSRFALLLGTPQGSTPNEKLSKSIWNFFPVSEVVDAYRNALTKGAQTVGVTLELDPTGTRKRFYSLSVSPLHKLDGGVYGAVGIFHDVTELKSAEQIRIDFVANVSHELRTPLTSIKGYTDTLILDVESGRPMEKAFLEIIARNVSRLMNLISDLLDLSALESTDVLQKADIQLGEFTERVAKQLEAAIAGRKQTIKLKVGRLWLKADPKRLEQVLVNLLENASKYTPSGGHIEVEWNQEVSDICLRVSDNGPGIPPEHHSRLFERFYRVDKARSRDQGGTGLGLAIVKHILQRHGGSVAVESEVGAGSRFICRFPAQ